MLLCVLSLAAPCSSALLTPTTLCTATSSAISSTRTSNTSTLVAPSHRIASFPASQLLKGFSISIFISFSTSLIPSCSFSLHPRACLPLSLISLSIASHCIHSSLPSNIYLRSTSLLLYQLSPRVPTSLALPCRMRAPRAGSRLKQAPPHLRVTSSISRGREEGGPAFALLRLAVAS